MKKTVLFTLLFVFALFHVADGQVPTFWGMGSGSMSNNQWGSVKWEKTSHNFGTVHFDKAETVVFTYKNTGGKPLVITKVDASCGCTEVKYSEAPVMPNQSGQIKAVYTADHTGSFDKTILVYFNIEDSMHTLRIKGTVAK